MGRDQLRSYEHLVPRPAILFGIYVVLHSFDHRDLHSTWQEYSDRSPEPFDLV